VRLNLSWNNLTTLPESIGSCFAHLEVLDISHNKFTHLPKRLVKVTSLVELHVQDNELQELRYDILQLKSLQVLDVSNNRLSSIPSKLIQKLKLRFFRFSGNQLLIHRKKNS
jgi:Leucine-rich repeat (LRR) protein